MTLDLFHRKGGRRGIVNIEFILSVVVFLGTLSFITITIGREAISLRENSLYGQLKESAVQISDVLVFDKGSPEDWETKISLSEAQKIGFSTGERYVLSKQKLLKLNEFCRKEDQSGAVNPDYKQNYEKIKDILGQKREINITIATGDGLLLDCSPAVVSLLRSKFSVNRIVTVTDASFGREMGELNITLID